MIRVLMVGVAVAVAVTTTSAQSTIRGSERKPAVAPRRATSPSVVAVPQSGPFVAMSIPDFLDRNFIGREPVRESTLACTPQETVRLLQMREGMATHVHDRVDEIIYVVAGEGTLRLGNDTVSLRAASLVVVPHGRGHAFERRGRKPLIVVSTLAGAACEPDRNAR